MFSSSLNFRFSSRSLFLLSFASSSSFFFFSFSINSCKDCSLVSTHAGPGLLPPLDLFGVIFGRDKNSDIGDTIFLAVVVEVTATVGVVLVMSVKAVLFVDVLVITAVCTAVVLVTSTLSNVVVSVTVVQRQLL